MLQYPKRLSLSAALLLGLSGMAATAGAESPDQDSVHSWGRWEVLAPAAGGVPTVSALPAESGVELRPGEATKLTPEFQSVTPPEQRLVVIEDSNDITNSPITDEPAFSESPSSGGVTSGGDSVPPVDTSNPGSLPTTLP